MLLSELAERLEGRLLGTGAGETVAGISTIREAGPGEVCYYGNRAYREYLPVTRALAVITSEELSTSAPNQVIVEDAYDAFRKALELFRDVSVTGFATVHASAVVHESALLGEGVHLGPCCVVDAGARVGDGTEVGACSYVGPSAVIGSGCLLAPGCFVGADCVLGDRVAVGPRAVVGSDGFGFVPRPDGHLKVPQNGNVVLGDDVELGAGTTVDRATVGSTVIGAHTKVDNLVHIAHNVSIGRGCFLAAQTGIAGSTVVGDGAVFAGQVGVVGHVRIGDGAVMAAKSGISKDVPDGATVFGIPARPMDLSKRIIAAMNELPEFRRKVLRFMAETVSREEDSQ